MLSLAVVVKHSNDDNFIQPVQLLCPPGVVTRCCLFRSPVHPEKSTTPEASALPERVVVPRENAWWKAC